MVRFFFKIFFDLVASVGNCVFKGSISTSWALEISLFNPPAQPILASSTSSSSSMSSNLLPSERRVCNHCCVGMTFFYMCQQINLFFYSTLIFTDASSSSNSNQKEAVGRQALGMLSNGNLANTLRSCSLLQFGGISVSGF